MLLKKPVAAAAVGSLIFAGLTACGYPPPAGVPAALAIVVGNHENAPAAVQAPSVSTALDWAIDGQTSVTILEDDGAPSVTATANLRSQARNATARSIEKNTYRQQLDAALAAAAPQVAETDPLDALDLAGRAVASARVRRIVVRDSGLQTTGALRFQDRGMLQANAGDIADLLQAKGLLPHVAGDTIVLSGIGDTVAPQPRLTIQDRAALLNDWITILTRAGAHVQADPAPVTGAAPTGSPAVTVVPVTPVIITIKLPTCADPVRVTVLPASALFVQDEATLINPSTAARTLAPLARNVRTYGGIIDLLGTTARVGDRAGQVRLSRARAAAIRDLLVHILHVPASRVSPVKGVGSYWPGYLIDHDAAGHLLPAPAVRNRSVIVTVRRPAATIPTHPCGGI